MVLLPGCLCCPCGGPFPAKIIIELTNVVGSPQYRAITQSDVVQSGQQFDRTISYLFKPLPVAGVYELPKNPTLNNQGGANYVYEDEFIRLFVTIGALNLPRRVFDFFIVTKQALRQKILPGAGAVVPQGVLDSESWNSDCQSTRFITFEPFSTQDNNTYPVCSPTEIIGNNRFSQDCFPPGSFRSNFEGLLGGDLAWSAPSGGSYDFGFLHGAAPGSPLPPAPPFPWRLSGQFFLPVGRSRFAFFFQTEQFWQPEAGSFEETFANYSFDVSSILLVNDDESVVEIPYI